MHAHVPSMRALPRHQVPCPHALCVQDVPGRTPDHTSALLIAAAQDLTQGNSALYREGAELHLEHMLAFCAHVAGLKPRIWRDAGRLQGRWPGTAKPKRPAPKAA